MCVRARQIQEGKLFLYFDSQQVGSVSVRRWMGTENWKSQVQEYFDRGQAQIKRGLDSRKNPEEFELAVVRLLNELRAPTVWYGDRSYHDRPDLAACIELSNEWIVVLGECTVQKPSAKFTPLLARTKELESLLQGEIRVLPVVFTSSPVSAADRWPSDRHRG